MLVQSSHFKIYLAGYINNNKLKECAEWRDKIRTHYENWKGKERYPIDWLDPLNGEFGYITKEGLQCALPGKALVDRDYNSVKIADLIIANMDTFGAQRPLTGTIFELAWAWLMHKPVIVITNDDNYKFHPFITDTASIVVPSVKELLENKYINYFFKGKVSAESQHL